MKTISKILFFILFFSISLFAKVTLISPNNFISNEVFTFEIEAIGNDIKFPEIKKIENNIVQTLGTSRSITNINGNISRKIKKTYQLISNDSFTIPSFSIEIDGKTYKTNEKKIQKKSIEKSISNAYSLDLIVEKKSLFVGEENLLTLKFKYRKDLQIVDLSLNMPTFKNLWMKQLKNQKNYDEGVFRVQELEFLSFPQKDGEIIIPAIRIDAKILDNQFSSYSLFQEPTKSIKIYSNSIVLDVKKLPENVDLIGEFILESSINKNEVNENEPISFKINIEGYGNIEDIKDIKLNIKDSTVYENKAKIKSEIVNKKNKFTYEKSFSILSSKDFKIPSIELKYYDKNIKKIVTQKTKEYEIKVKSKIKRNNEVILEKDKKAIEKIVEEKIVYKTSLKDRIVFFVLGLFFSLLIIGLYKYVKNKKIKEVNELPIIKKIKKSKSSDDLIKILIPYLCINKDLDDIIFKLEKRKNIDLKIIKKEIIEILKKLDI